MANNALIQGAALTGKKFLDVAGAVKKGLVDSGSFSRQSTSRVDENKAIQSRVNNYMSNDLFTLKLLKMPHLLMILQIQIICYM